VIDRLYALAADQPDALALLRLAHTDVELQWTMPELRFAITRRRLGHLVDVDADPGRYTPLRVAVEMWMEQDGGLRDDLTPDEADGEVLYTLFVLLHGTPPCRRAFRTAYRLDMLHDGAACEHSEAAV
jgi:hypothetical protein